MEIYKDIEMPKRAKRRVYPYREMQIEDCFFLPGADIQIVCNNNWRAGKKLGMRFISERRVHNGVEGVMTWRAE